MSSKPFSILLFFALAAGLLLGACVQTTPNPTDAPAVPTQSEPAPAVEATAPPTEMPAAEPAASEPLVLTDALGNSLTLEKPAEKIVSLAPAITESLFAIGAGGQVVGRDQFSDYPAEALEVADIGGGFGDLNAEAIVSLAPDLVLASTLTPPEQLQALEELGLEAFVFEAPPDLEGMYANLATIGQITGREAEALALVESLDSRVTELEMKLAGVTERPLVFYELDGTDPNSPWTPGAGTYIDLLIGMAGAENVGGDMGSDWIQISIESLLEQDPDFILLGDATWGGVTVESVQARESWSSLTAVQEGRVYPFDDNLVARPGPRLVDGLEALAKLFHPEAFE